MYRGLIGDIMVINNQADVEEIEGIEFINRIPLHMQQIMANISRMLNDGWHMRDRRTKNDFEQLLKFFKGSDRLEAIVMDTVTWKQTEIEEETLTILQVLILRFINVHLPNIFATLDECNNWKSENNLWNRSSLCQNVEIKKQESWIWEKIFEIRETKKKYDSMSKKEQRSYIGSYRVDISGIGIALKRIKKVFPKVKKEIVSADSIKQFEQLKAQYNPYAQKAEKLNNIVKKFSDEQKIAQKATIEDMRKIVELLEKNLNGKLSTVDMVEAEKQLEHWKRELDSMTEIVKEILVEV